MSMFFLSLMLFAWLVFDWHAALPMMIAMFCACYGAPPPSRADSAPVTTCPHPTARATLAKALRSRTAAPSNADMYHYALRLIRKFNLQPEEMVTGKFDVGGTR